MKEDFVNYGESQVPNELLGLIDKMEAVIPWLVVTKKKFKECKKKKCHNRKLLKKLKNIIGVKSTIVWVPIKNYEEYVQGLINGNIRIKKPRRSH